MIDVQFWGVTCGWYHTNPRNLEHSYVAHVEVTRFREKALAIFLAWQAEAQYDYVALHLPPRASRGVREEGL